MGACREIRELFSPNQHPKNFCISSLCMSITTAIILFISAIILHPNSSENDSSQLDASLILDLDQRNFYDSPFTYTLTLDTNKYPNTYGAMVYVENLNIDMNGATDKFQISLKYKLPNQTTLIDCGDSIVKLYPQQFGCDIHPLYFPQSTTFTITLSNCNDREWACSAQTSFVYLSVRQLSSTTKYHIQTSFGSQYSNWDIPITRYHYFKYNAQVLIGNIEVNSFKISLKGEDWWWDEPESIRCLYISADSHTTFVNADTAQYQNCNGSCTETDMCLETLFVNTANNKESEYWISLSIEFDESDPPLDMAGTDLQLFIKEDLQSYILIIVGAAVIIVVIGMMPACVCYWKGSVKRRYAMLKLNREKAKFIKHWKLFNAKRYRMLVRIFVERGIVDVIQSYMDDLESFPELRDDAVFVLWYSEKYNFKQAFGIQLQRPLLINRQSTKTFV